MTKVHLMELYFSMEPGQTSTGISIGITIKTFICNTHLFLNFFIKQILKLAKMKDFWINMFTFSFLCWWELVLCWVIRKINLTLNCPLNF